MPDRPNIMIIMADQLRADALGCYGNSIVQTPNIDRLAAEGVRFENCFVQNPVCMPSRSTIMTGRYPHVHRCVANGIKLSEDETTYPKVFRDAGYQTSAHGKIHLIPKQNRHLYGNYHSYGFQVVNLAEGDRSCPDDYHAWLKRTNADVYEAWLKMHYTHKPIPNATPEELHEATWIRTQATNFMQHNLNEPFLLYMSFFDPHPSLDPPLNFLDMYDPADMPSPAQCEREHEDKPPYFAEWAKHKADFTDWDWKRAKAAYYGLVSLVDKQVGEAVRTLEELGLRDNTLVLFMSDHGELLGDHGYMEKGAFYYDCSVRVPLIISWPARLPQGRCISSLVQGLDIAPTLFDFAGIEIPRSVQGQSLRPLCTGERDKIRDYVLIEDKGALRVPLFENVHAHTIRTERYKLTHYVGEGWGLLFDLIEDPDEFVNRYHDKSYESVVNELKLLMLDVLAASEDPTPVPTEKF